VLFLLTLVFEIFVQQVKSKAFGESWHRGENSSISNPHCLGEEQWFKNQWFSKMVFELDHFVWLFLSRKSLRANASLTRTKEAPMLLAAVHPLLVVQCLSTVCCDFFIGLSASTSNIVSTAIRESDEETSIVEAKKGLFRSWQGRCHHLDKLKCPLWFEVHEHFFNVLLLQRSTQTLLDDACPGRVIRVAAAVSCHCRSLDNDSFATTNQPQGKQTDTCCFDVAITSVVHFKIKVDLTGLDGATPN